MSIKLDQDGVSVKINKLAKIFPGDKLIKFRRKFYVKTKIREGVYKAANIFSTTGPVGDKTLILPRMGAFKYLSQHFDIVYEVPEFRRIKVSKEASSKLILKE